MRKLVKQLELDAPGPSTYPYSNFRPILIHLFSKFLQDCLQAFTNQTIHKLLLTHSDYQKLQPHKNLLDPHSSLFLSHPHDVPAPQEVVTEDLPLALILNQKGWNDRAHIVSHCSDGSLCWPGKQRIKSQWSLRLTKLPKWHSVFSLTPTFSKVQDHWFQTTGLNYKLKINHSFREFFIGGV